MEGSSIHIVLAFGKTKLDMEFEPTKADVVALVGYINSRVSTNEEDPTAKLIASSTDQLNVSTDLLFHATKEL